MTGPCWTEFYLYLQRLAQFAAASTAPISPVGAFDASPGNILAPAGQAPAPIVQPQAAVAAPPRALLLGWSTHMAAPAKGGRSRRVHIHSSGKKLHSLPAVLRFNSSLAAAPPSPASALPTVGAQASPAYRMHPLTQPTFLHEIMVENDRPSKRARRARDEFCLSFFPFSSVFFTWVSSRQICYANLPHVLRYSFVALPRFVTRQKRGDLTIQYYF